MLSNTNPMLCGLQVSLYAQNATELSPKVMAAINATLADFHQGANLLVMPPCRDYSLIVNL